MFVERNIWGIGDNQLLRKYIGLVYIFHIYKRGL